MDHITSVEGREMTTLVEVPEHSGTVLTTGSTERTIGRHGNSVDVSGVSDEVGSELAVVKVPDLDELVPTGRHDNGLLEVGGEADARNPLGVTVLGDDELALSKGVPEVDGAVARSRDDLTVIGREGDGENILLVSDETTGGGAGLEVPETESSIPRSGKSEVAVGRDGNILDEMSVSGKTLLGGSVVVLLAGKVPDDERAITRGGDDHILLLEGGGDGGDPAVVALELTLKDKTFDRSRHG